MLSATNAPINPLAENTAQTHPTTIIINLAQNGRKALVMATTRAERFSGNMQYPSRHKDEKKETSASNNYALIVTITLPNQTMKNIDPNTTSLSFPVEMLRVTAKQRQKRSGPQRSPLNFNIKKPTYLLQSFNYSFMSSFFLGSTIALNLAKIFFKSLF